MAEGLLCASVSSKGWPKLKEKWEQKVFRFKLIESPGTRREETERAIGSPKASLRIVCFFLV